MNRIMVLFLVVRFMAVDELNKKILEILRKNGRTSFTNIAEEVRVSEATVRKRIKVLEEKKVILGYTVVLDPLKMGYNVVAMVGLDIDPKKFLFVSEKIRELDEVRWVATSTGEHMLLMEVWAEDGQKLSRILTGKIGKIDGVRKVQSSLILEKQKSF